jgi:2-polyprenyl-3-methyl-5-hydroxy-6-metoxy-1,4-benzoquinol methylase
MASNIYNILKDSIATPEIFTKSSDKFWDDDHISAQMLALHLNPEVEAASKTRETIEAETRFIIAETSMDETKFVLDLGCGPGLYVREFALTGAHVTGIDMSERSIDYANANIKSLSDKTKFIKMNYLDLDFHESFDIVTLIFFDFCALNPVEQNKLLARINAALKPNGIFVFDVMNQNRQVSVSSSIKALEPGFWSPRPHIEILNTVIYENPRTEGLQYTIIDNDGSLRTIRIYHRLFNLPEIDSLLQENGLRRESLYMNLQGQPITEKCETWGIFARKCTPPGGCL